MSGRAPHLCLQLLELLGFLELLQLLEVVELLEAQIYFDSETIQTKTRALFSVAIHAAYTLLQM